MDPRLAAALEGRFGGNCGQQPQWGPRNVSAAVPAWTLQVDSLSISFHIKKMITRKPHLRRRTFTPYSKQQFKFLSVMFRMPHYCQRTTWQNLTVQTIQFPPYDGRNSSRNTLWYTKVWIKYIINFEVHFVGYLNIMDLIKARKIEEKKTK